MIDNQTNLGRANGGVSATRRQSLRFCGVVLCLLVVTQNASAQQVPTDPTSTHIFPAGGRRGTKVDVRVGGECLPPGTRFRLFGEGVLAPWELGSPATGNYAPSPRRKPNEQPTTSPREWESQIEIADDAPLGSKIWRLSCARGGTGGRPFIVGDLPEFRETEPNSHPNRAELVELPVTINGQIAGESDLDYFRFEVKAGDLVSIDVTATRLGSALDPIVQVIGPDGRRILVNESRIGSDPVIAFHPESTGEYQLVISNVTYQGGPSYVYRVTISTTPIAQFVFPAGGQAGTVSEIAFLTLTDRGPRKTVFDRVAFPDIAGEFWQRSLQIANAIPLAVNHVPEGVETTGNDTRDSATDLAWPRVMNGQFETISDEDWFRFNGRKDTPLTLVCSAFPRWSPALPVVSITNSEGGVLASASAVQAARGMIRIEWTPPVDGTYFICSRDLQQGIKGGSEFIYRLQLQESVPDFTLSVKNDLINVVQGGRTEVDVTIERCGGCTAPIELSVEGLPEGIRIEGEQVAAGKLSTKLVFIADAEARSCDVTLKIQGSADINGNQVLRRASATHLGHDLDGVGLGVTEIDHIQLTVVHKPVFRLYCNEAYQYAHRGTIYPYLMEIERLEGFKGPIQLQVADRQIKDLDGIEIVTTTIPQDQNQVMLPLYLPETMHINVQAHSNVYSQGYVEFQDKFGQKQTMLVVSTMRCMIRTLPTVTKLRTENRDLTVTPGCTIRCPLILERTTKFSGPMRVELIDAANGITGTPEEIKPDQSHVDILIQVDPNIQPTSNMALRFRAIGQMKDDVQVITETQLPIHFTK